MHFYVIVIAVIQCVLILIAWHCTAELQMNRFLGTSSCISVCVEIYLRRFNIITCWVVCLGVLKIIRMTCDYSSDWLDPLMLLLLWWWTERQTGIKELLIVFYVSLMKLIVGIEVVLRFIIYYVTSSFSSPNHQGLELTWQN